MINTDRCIKIVLIKQCWQVLRITFVVTILLLNTQIQNNVLYCSEKHRPWRSKSRLEFYENQTFNYKYIIYVDWYTLQINIVTVLSEQHQYAKPLYQFGREQRPLVDFTRQYYWFQGNCFCGEKVHVILGNLRGVIKLPDWVMDDIFLNILKLHAHCC